MAAIISSSLPVRPWIWLTALVVCVAVPPGSMAPALLAAQQAGVAGVVHEAPPTHGTPVADARIVVAAGAGTGQSGTTGPDGRFGLAVSPAAGMVLEVTKAGFEPARVTMTDVSRATAIDVALKPEARDLTLKRSGADDCADLPKPPQGVPGLREYARIAVHHDGVLNVTAAKLPFSNNPGYVYRQTEAGWVPNELDYILIRSPLPLLGGFVYVITFGGDNDLCGSWSIDATHPN